MIWSWKKGFKWTAVFRLLSHPEDQCTWPFIIFMQWVTMEWLKCKTRQALGYIFCTNMMQKLVNWVNVFSGRTINNVSKQWPVVFPPLCSHLRHSMHNYGWNILWQFTCFVDPSGETKKIYIFIFISPLHNHQCHIDLRLKVVGRCEARLSNEPNRGGHLKGSTRSGSLLYCTLAYCAISAAFSNWLSLQHLPHETFMAACGLSVCPLHSFLGVETLIHSAVLVWCVCACTCMPTSNGESFL